MDMATTAVGQVLCVAAVVHMRKVWVVLVVALLLVYLLVLSLHALHRRVVLGAAVPFLLCLAAALVAPAHGVVRKTGQCSAFTRVIKKKKRSSIHAGATVLPGRVVKSVNQASKDDLENLETLACLLGCDRGPSKHGRLSPGDGTFSWAPLVLDK